MREKEDEERESQSILTASPAVQARSLKSFNFKNFLSFLKLIQEGFLKIAASAVQRRIYECLFDIYILCFLKL